MLTACLKSGIFVMYGEYTTCIQVVYYIRKVAVIAMLTENNRRVGLSSFAFRYNIGFADFRPPVPMTALKFLHEAKSLGFNCVQLCENLGYAKLSDKELSVLADTAKELGIVVEVGMRGISDVSLARHLDIAELMSSDLLRIVLAESDDYLKDPKGFKEKTARMIDMVLPRCRQSNIRIGIENHFDLPTKDLVDLVDMIKDPNVGLIYDTTNGIGFIEKPLETLELMKHKLFSIHLKDYTIKKVEAGYFMTGAVLGEGLLNAVHVLDTIRTLGSDISIIMEMTVKRQAHHSVDEVLVWERESIKRSADYLFNLI